ncbi:hypothetical protein, partial [Streptomyces clavifer]|uniref:hypothetical protein n=1 Tax=Streptomyces clavifer TaxID=68188 RepID=UPI0034D7570B
MLRTGGGQSSVPFEGIGDEIAWAAFRSDFLRKFIPAHIREQKLREFQALVQGDMTVYQYELRFTQLSRFAEALITPESERIRRFVDGLRDDIQLHMTCIDYPTYEEAVRKAYWAEERLQRVEAMHQRKRMRFVPVRPQPMIRPQQHQFQHQRPAGHKRQFH